MVRIDDVIDAYLKERSADTDFSKIQKSYIYSAKQHEGQMRKSGEPYMIHPLEVAKITAEMGLDEASVCAALLHDTIEDTDSTREDLTSLFGEDISALVDGVTKLSGVNFSRQEERQAESFRKFLVALSSDIRVLLVKLTDRLHNMRTLEHMKSSSRERIAQETRDIYAPLADRLGISWLKAELDDLSFKYIETSQYEELAARVERTHKQRDVYIHKNIEKLRDFFAESGFADVEISGRLKNLFSIYKKMQDKGLEYEDVHDAIAYRVVCKTVPDCYAILGLVHTRWMPIPGRFKDYIAMPKPNRYQSLHTTVIGKDGERVEIQIRTDEMHKIAKSGIAAHWAYKQGKSTSREKAAEGFQWLRGLVEAQQEISDSDEFFDSVKVDLFRDEVFVFTPQGDLKNMRHGATALDFAFSVHTEVGNHCVGARVNGVQVPLRTELRNGDLVEVVTSKTQRPSTHWLDIVVTSRAKNKIRSFLRAEERKQSKIVGHDLLEKGMRKYGCSFNKMYKKGEVEEIARKMRFGSAEDMIAAVGYGKIDKTEVIERLLPEEKRDQLPKEVKESPFEKVLRKVTKQDEGIVLDGLDNLLVRFARCCNPLPGEDIVGYISRGRGIIIHRRNCRRAAALDPERRTIVSWSRRAVSQRPVQLRVTTGDRPGILANLTNVFQKHGISISSAHCEGDGSNQGINIFTFMVKDLNQLNELTRSLKQNRDVVEVERMHN